VVAFRFFTSTIAVKCSLSTPVLDASNRFSFEHFSKGTEETIMLDQQSMFGRKSSQMTAQPQITG